MTHELITELANTLERMDGRLKVRHFSGLMPDEIALIKEARQYLASAREKNMTTPTDIKTLQAEGKGPAPCARFCEATAFNIEIAGWRREQAENLTNQCKLVDQINALGKMADELREERDALKDAARQALDALEVVEPYINTTATACRGDKCREPWCASCNTEEEAEASAQKGYRAAVKAFSTIAALKAVL